jgi:hypothetical protein
MKVYVSGSFSEQARLREEANSLRAMGFDVISTWLYEPQRPSHLNENDWNRALADKDVAEVFASDILILDLDGTSTTGGRYTEWGVACYPGSIRRRYIVGGAGKAGVFHTLAHARFLDWEELRAVVAKGTP